MARTRFTGLESWWVGRGRRGLGVVGPTPSIVAGPPWAIIETPRVAVVGPHARRPHEVIEISDSESEDDGPRVIVLSDSESDDVFVSPRRTPPRVVDVGPMCVDVDPAGDVYVGPRVMV